LQLTNKNIEGKNIENRRGEKQKSTNYKKNIE
jgi:hypothetical protein